MNSSARAEGDGSAGYQCISVLSCPGMRNVLRAKSALLFLGFIFVALLYVRVRSALNLACFMTHKTYTYVTKQKDNALPDPRSALVNVDVLGFRVFETYTFVALS